ncbi:response regulator [Ferruginibacter albus]|uniref:response regulator n=1 Tax=Ferruginibacter albus TaxID=2875540 RepID=UPI001CC54125|nr:response regulator [Ferruginibacter albus]UAY53326.1 response regulator [Ferruginibacter albus]
MNILILDDDKDLCVLLKTFFEKKGHVVHIANSLVDGLNIIDHHMPSIVFIDNYLPDGEGWKAAQTIKVKYPSLNINLMSAKDRSFNSLEEYENVVWEKPISVQQLETYLQFLKLEV